MFIFGYPKLLFLISKITFWISKISRPTCFRISKIVFSDIWNNYFRYHKKMNKMLIPLVIQVLIQWAQAMGASNSISSEYNIKTSREISAPFYTGTSNRKPVFYNIQEHIGYSSFHQFDKKAIVAHLVKRFRQVKGAYVNHRTTVDIVIDNTTQCEYIACAQLLPCLKSK